MKKCVVCGAEFSERDGVVLFGEFVCNSCDRIGTGRARKQKARVEMPNGRKKKHNGNKPRARRSQLREEIILEHLKNDAKEKVKQ